MGRLPAVLLLLMMLVGGCTGSTAGGIKMFRLRVLFSAPRVQARRQIYPHGTFVIVYNGAPVADSIRAGVTSISSSTYRRSCSSRSRLLSVASPLRRAWAARQQRSAASALA